MTVQRLLRIAAWCALLAIAALTLSPKGTRVLAFGGDYSRAAAYGLAALTFCLAYPRHRGLVLLALVCAAGTLEVAQALVPNRHGRIYDFAIKATAALVGAGASIPVRRVLATASPGRRDS
jgi:VanZ family protein